MVTGDLRIRRFTPMAEKVLNVIPTDVGRPIGDIKPNIDLPDLEKLITEAVDTVSPVEREAKDRQGTTYLVRIRPYKNVENRIDGAVLTLFDLEMGRRHDRLMGDQTNTIEAILAVANQPMMVLDSRNRLMAANDHFYRTFSLNREAVMGKSVYELSDGQWQRPQLKELLERQLPRDRRVNGCTIGEMPVDGTASEISVDANCVGTGENTMAILAINLKSQG